MKPIETRLIQKEIEGMTHTIVCELYNTYYHLRDPLTEATHDGNGGFAQAVEYVEQNGGV